MASSYNCSDSTHSAYGESNYGTCTGQSVGAPNTGVFGQFTEGGAFTILAPLVATILLVSAVAAIVSIRKKFSKP